MSIVYLFAAISILAISLKVLILIQSGNFLKKASPFFLAFFTGLFCANILEILVFFNLHNTSSSLPFLKTYYFLLVLTFTGYFLQTLETAKYLNKLTLRIVGTLFSVVTLSIYWPDFAIVGVKSLGYSLTREPGSGYWVVQLGLLLPLVLSFLIGYFSWQRNNDQLLRRKSLSLLIAGLPIIVSIFAIVLLMAVGIKVNATGIFSLFVCASLWFLIYIETRENQYKFMYWLPKSPQKEFMKSFAEQISNPSGNMKEITRLVEAEIIRETLLRTDGNRQKAADLLGISITTLGRKIQYKQDEA